MNKILVAVALVCSAKIAFAGQYDFSYSNLNHLKGAYKMCETMGFSGNGPDCPIVYSTCWSRYTYLDHGHVKTKCKKSSSFSGTPRDAAKAINDANDMIASQPQ